MWKPERFNALYRRLQDLMPGLAGFALVAEDGSLLLDAGGLVTEPGIIGVTTAALAKLAVHITHELGECANMEICIRCAEHQAVFYPLPDREILLLVLPIDSRMPPELGALITTSGDSQAGT